MQCPPWNVSARFKGLLFLFCCCLMGLIPSLYAAPPAIEVVRQLTEPPAGLTFLPKGAFLLSLSFESKPEHLLIEINKAGESRPYPPQSLSEESPSDSEPLLDAVEGIQNDKEGIIWMVDHGRRNEMPPKILGWNNDQGRLARVFHLVQPTVLPGSHLHDLAVDLEHSTIYLADPAEGGDAALIILDSQTGRARRVLQGHPSVTPVAGLPLSIDGVRIQNKRLDGSDADPGGGVRAIALDRKNEWLYFGPMRSLKLYRIKTSYLRDATLSAEKLANYVEQYSAKPVSNGISLDTKGNIYVSDIAAKGIGMISVDTRKYALLATDPRVIWPDGLCFGTDGKLYFFNNALRTVPAGRNTSSRKTSIEHYLFRLETPGAGRPGD